MRKNDLHKIEKGLYKVCAKKVNSSTPTVWADVVHDGTGKRWKSLVEPFFITGTYIVVPNKVRAESPE